jgi:hypothetical protein
MAVALVKGEIYHFEIVLDRVFGEGHLVQGVLLAHVVLELHLVLLAFLEKLDASLSVHLLAVASRRFGSVVQLPHLLIHQADGF